MLSHFVIRPHCASFFRIGPDHLLPMHYYQSIMNIFVKIKNVKNQFVSNLIATQIENFIFYNNVDYRSIMGADDQAISYVKILTITSGWNMTLPGGYRHGSRLCIFT